MNKYKVEIMATHTVWLWAEDENDARTKAELEVFKKIDERNGDMLTGYKVIPLRADADKIKEKLNQFIK